MARETKLAKEAFATILATCQEVAHEVEDPTQAVAEIEGVARRALAALNREDAAASTPQPADQQEGEHRG